MSSESRTGGPLALNELDARLSQALAEVRRMCQPGERWQMRVPVDPEDSDEVLTHALLGAKKLVAECEALRTALRPFARAAYTRLQALEDEHREPPADTWGVGDMFGYDELTYGDLRRANDACEWGPDADVVGAPERDLTP